MDELDIICGSIQVNIKSYADLLELPGISDARDPIYSEVSNTYIPSVSIKYGDGDYTSIWLYGGKIIDSLHPCVLNYRSGCYNVYYYSSVMKKHNQPRIIFYSVKTKQTKFVKEITGSQIATICGVSDVHATEAQFIKSIFIRDPPQPIFKFAD